MGLDEFLLAPTFGEGNSSEVVIPTGSGIQNIRVGEQPAPIFIHGFGADECCNKSGMVRLANASQSIAVCRSRVQVRINPCFEKSAALTI